VAWRRRRQRTIAAVMALYPVGERFFEEFTLRQVLLNAAKSGCMDALPLCKRREPTDGSVPAASTSGRVCRGHGTWEVLVACQGQLRLAPSGHVIGIETNPPSGSRLATCSGPTTPGICTQPAAASANCARIRV
jgi:hypothetical protein